MLTYFHGSFSWTCYPSRDSFHLHLEASRSKYRTRKRPSLIRAFSSKNGVPTAPSKNEFEPNTLDATDISDDKPDIVDVAIIGAGLGGLCAGAILNTLYGKKVGIYESHYLPGGCAHAFNRTASNGEVFTFDSGPTILLGCSAPPFNPLRQVLDAVGQEVEWIRYDGWGMIERPGRIDEKKWRFELGPDVFQAGPLAEFGGEKALQEFTELREKTAPLVRAAADIPAMAMRPGRSALVPLLRYLPALLELIKQGEELTRGTFAPFMDGPLYTVTDQWLRSWLDALSFSLSGLPASRTSAAAMAYVLFDMHRPGMSRCNLVPETDLC
jgi:phytoene dehydrogenase-like protein